jgi:hypothetical protein
VQRSSGSSVSIVSGYGLDYREIDFRSPAEARDFSSNLCVQTGSGAHSTSYPLGTGGPLPGGKTRPGRDADHSAHLMPISKMSRSYTSFSPCASICVLWDCFTVFAKCNMYTTLVTPVVLYEYRSESWTLTKAGEEELSIF